MQPFLALLCSTALIGNILVAGLSLSSLVEKNQELRTNVDPNYEVLYLPKQEAVSALSLGWKNIASNILWFKTVSYFGKHYATDKNLAWLNHMCHLVTELNPKAEHVYKFCANMLSWEMHKYGESIALLTQAIEKNPENWVFYYLRGFTYLYFLNDKELAKDDLLKAAQFPESSVIVKRLAAKNLAALSDKESALLFLESAIRAESDPHAREVLLKKYLEIKGTSHG